MHIAVFGASGVIGTRIVREALSRGHEVTAIARNPFTLDTAADHLSARQADARDAASVAAAVAGHDAVVSAVGPGSDQQPEFLAEVAQSLIEGLRQAGVRRLIVVNGAGSLEVAPGLMLMDSPRFHAAWRPYAVAHLHALEAIKTHGGDLDWTVLSPADQIAPGERTGAYRTGTDTLVEDAQGVSRISAEDYAVALIDELERPAFIQRRFTAAY